MIVSETHPVMFSGFLASRRMIYVSPKKIRKLSAEAQPRTFVSKSFTLQLGYSPKILKYIKTKKI